MYDEDDAHYDDDCYNHYHPWPSTFIVVNIFFLLILLERYKATAEEYAVFQETVATTVGGMCLENYCAWCSTTTTNSITVIIIFILIIIVIVIIIITIIVIYIDIIILIFILILFIVIFIFIIFITRYLII